MKSSVHKELEEKLSKDHACYVLVTLGERKADGTHDVEMSYGGGDPVLASYLLSGAQACIDEEVEEEAVE
jgi:hypothetical protein